MASQIGFSGKTALVLERPSPATLDNDSNNRASYVVLVFRPCGVTGKRTPPNLRDGSSLIAEARGSYATAFEPPASLESTSD